jgi:hypothetical protein
MRIHLYIAIYVYVSVSVVGVGGADGAAAFAGPGRQTAVAASCAALTPAQQFAGARLVFVGRMLPGPSTLLDGRRVLDSPARMRVTRYLKGHGPRTVTVETAITIERHGATETEDGIEPQAGQRWKIYTGSRRQPFATSICAGSARVKSPASDAAPDPQKALARVWCAAGGCFRTAVTRPARPLGAPVLVSATEGAQSQLCGVERRRVAPANRRGVDDRGRGLAVEQELVEDAR